MKFHHIGIATRDIAKTTSWIKTQFEIKTISDKVYDKNQDATLQMIETKDVNIELVSGNIVSKFISKSITYYHICYEVEDLNQAIKGFNNSIVVSSPTEAILFDNRKVAFLMTPIGLVELLESKSINGK